jgi:hypothetical protein
VVIAVAIAAFAEPFEASVHGDVKTFFVVDGAYPWFGFSDDSAPALDAMGLSEAEALDAYGLAAHPAAQGIGAGRLKLVVHRGDAVRLEAHWAIAAQNTVESSGLAGASSGVARSAPELVRLTWRPDLGESVGLQHRIDRLVLSARVRSVDVAVGRQPVSFGSGRVFTPLDLVNPFHPATIDTEYKPGVDAVRVDGFVGVSGKVTAVAAYAGDAPVIGAERREGPILDDLVLAATGQGTVGVTDLGGFVGMVHGDPVVGVSVVSAAGPFGLHGDAALTVPGDEDAYVRAVIGADERPTPKTTLTAEAYVQTFGATDPGEYLEALDDPRFQRGELWQLGQVYAMVGAAQEVTPIVAANLAIIGNLRDPSALVAAGVTWSVADEAVVAFGGYYGLGKRPDTVDFDLVDGELVGPSDAAVAGSVNSEFGLYPAVGYVQVRTYF